MVGLRKVESDGVSLKSVIGGYAGQIKDLAVVSAAGQGKFGKGFVMSPRPIRASCSSRPLAPTTPQRRRGG